MKDKVNGAITWIQINNWVPIVVSAIAISGSFFVLQRDVALSNLKLTFIENNQMEMIQLLKSQGKDNTNLALKVERLETLHDAANE